MFITVVLLITSILINLNTSAQNSGKENIFEEAFVDQFINIRHGEAKWGDYDNDGDLDILLAGDTVFLHPIIRLYKNMGSTFVEDTLNELIGFADCNISWNDFDNDSDLDILLAGRFSGSMEKSVIYENNFGLFTQVYPGDLIGLQRGDVDCADFDNDGDIDIIMAGLVNGAQQKITKLYENIGVGFIEVTALNVPQVGNPTIDWADYDNDGDLDFLLTGLISSNNRISAIYNNEDNSFVEVYNGSLIPVSIGACDWGDFDNDGDLDILLTGYSDGNGVANIYENTGSGFEEIYLNDLPGIYSSSVAWGDYDNDGDLDILLTGRKNDGSDITEIYTNNGSGFELLVNENLTGVVGGSAEWGDYDNDGDLDILITGSAGDTCITRIYENNILTQNTPPLPPENLDYIIISNEEVQLIWDDGFDNETPFNALSYNIWIGTDIENQNIKSSESEVNNGYRKLVKTGNVGQNNFWGIKWLAPGDYYWGVQSIDNTLAGSGFSFVDSLTLPGYFIATESNHSLGGTIVGGGTYFSGQNCTLIAEAAGLFEFIYWTENDTLVSYDPEISFIVNQDRTIIAHFETDHFINVFPNNLEGVFNCDVAWGDYDNDGDLDILISGSASYGSISKIYQNSGDGFSEVFHNLLVPVYHSTVDWVDFDNDNDLDIFISGIQTVNDPVSKLYENTGDTFIEVYQGSIPGVIFGDSDWGDYDNDGDLDLILIGTIVYPTNISSIFENTGDGFIEHADLGFPKLASGKIKWGDFDNDGDLDILLAGYSGPSDFTCIFENSYGNFIEVYINSLSDMSGPAMDWGDYDNDGDLDIVICGHAYTSSISEIYENTGEEFIQVFEGDIYPVHNGDLAWGDYDNDGDLDVIITGSNNSAQYGWTKLYINTGVGFVESQVGDFLDVGSGSLDWGDYDNDGDLDVLLAGVNQGNGLFTIVYQNNTDNTNTIPTQPQNLQFSNSSGNLILSWEASFDLETPQPGLSYNIRIGTTSGGSEIKSAEAILSSGKGLKTNIGNVMLNNNWILNDIEYDTLYWSVQAIDNGFAASVFAPEFIIVPIDTFQVLLSAFPVASGTTIGSGDYTEGDTCHAIPVPALNYGFLYWTENDTIISEDSVYSFIVYQDRELTAHFGLITNNTEIRNQNTITISPNPFKDNVIIRFGIVDNDKLVIRLLNSNLIEVYNVETFRNHEPLYLDMGMCAPGIYFLEFENIQGEILAVKKLIRVN